MVLYEWVLILVLVPGPLPNSNVEVVNQFKNKAQCEIAKISKVKSNPKRIYKCLPIDFN